MANKITEIFNKQLEPIFKKIGKIDLKREKILGVSFKDNEIQIVDLISKKGSWLVNGYTYQQIAGIGKDQDIYTASTYLGDQLRNVLDSVNSKAKDAVITLEASNVKTYNLQIPIMDLADLHEAVMVGGFWEQFDDTPETLEDLETSYQVVSTNDELGVMNISLLTIETKLAEAYINIFKLAGLSPIILDINPMSQVNAMAAAIGKENFDTPVAIFNYTKDSSYLTVASKKGFSITDINIVEADQVLLGTIEEIKDVTTEFWDEIFDRLASQIKQGLIEFETQYECDRISLINVVTDNAQTKNLFIGLEKQLEEVVIKSYDPEESITFANNEKKYLDALSNKSQIINCIGAGVRRLNSFNVDYENEIYSHNLLPRAHQLKINRKSNTFAKYCYSFSFVILLIGLIHILPFKLLKIIENNNIIVSYQGLMKDAEQKKTLAKAYQLKAQKIEGQALMLKSFGENKKTTTEILSSLTKNVPEDIRLTNFKISNQKDIVINGISKADNSIIQMFDAFSASKGVEKAKLVTIIGFTEEDRKQLYAQPGKTNPVSIPNEMISKKFTINLTLSSIDGEVFDNAKKIAQYKKNKKR
tara:strand:- start:4 stop:1767 length:1764 start_codon:yes stop_codon:yes gene_type:complete